MKKIASLLLLCAPLLAQEFSPASSLDQVLCYKLCPKVNKNAGQETAVFEQGDQPLSSYLTHRTNPPANIALKNSDDSLVSNFFFDTSFLYYFARQEGLNLATSGQVVTPIASSIASTAITNGTFLTQNFEFKPGFKLGLGLNVDDWQVMVDYSWIHQKTNTKQIAPVPASSNEGEGIWITNNWFQQTTVGGHSMAGPFISSSWKLKMDLLDFNASRPFYEGKNLIASPFLGLRSAWIEQKLNLMLTTNQDLGSSEKEIQSLNRSKSWGIGPRTGFESSYLLGKGFRLKGDAAMSLLYTHYTYVKHQEDSATSTMDLQCALNQKNIHTARPELEMGLGLSWGTYFANHRYHIDVAANYDFLLFWEQNMIRKNLDEAITGISATANNLYLHGLNLHARFNF